MAEKKVKYNPRFFSAVALRTERAAQEAVSSALVSCDQEPSLWGEMLKSTGSFLKGLNEPARS